MIDAYASRPHYADHLAPIVDALDETGRFGERWSPRSGEWGRTVGLRRGPELLARTVLVASSVDYARVAPSPVIYVEHGAGQAYPADPYLTASPSYAGGPGFDRVRLFLAPSERVADRWRTAYPKTPVAVVGCPKLDPWHRETRNANRGTSTVAVSFHWSQTVKRVAPEMRSALDHYRDGLGRLASWADSAGVRLLGHAHPRLWRILGPVYDRLRIEPVPDFADVLDLADVYACDNSSTLFEFASTDRPVVVMNAPWYRRDVEHGGRFWEWADVGAQVDDVDGLVVALSAALSDPGRDAAHRGRIVDEVYAVRDGSATSRAVRAIEEISHA